MDKSPFTMEKQNESTGPFSFSTSTAKLASVTHATPPCKKKVQSVWALTDLYPNYTFSHFQAKQSKTWVTCEGYSSHISQLKQRPQESFTQARPSDLLVEALWFGTPSLTCFLLCCENATTQCLWYLDNFVYTVIPLWLVLSVNMHQILRCLGFLNLLTLQSLLHPYFDKSFQIGWGCGLP